jgi:hypothetical protein
MKRDIRLSKLEGARPAKLSEAVRAWLGLRAALTPEETAREPVVDMDLSDLSPATREWLR